MEGFHPIIVTVVVPLLATLATAAVLIRYLPQAGGMAAFAGYLAAVLMIAAGAAQTSAPVNKVVFVGGLAAIAGLTLDGTSPRLSRLFPFFWLFGIAVVAWVPWFAFYDLFLMDALLLGYLLAIYVAWLTLMLPMMRDRPVHAHAAVLALGIGTGAAALISGLIIAGLLGLALGVAAGAGLGINLVSRHVLRAGYSLTLSAAISAAALASVVMMYGRLSWVSLAVLALIPLAALLAPAAKTRNGWIALYLGLPLGLALAGVLLAANPQWIEAWLPGPLRAIRPLGEGV